MSKNPLINEADVHLIETMQSDKLAAIEFVLQRLAGLYIDESAFWLYRRLLERGYSD